MERPDADWKLKYRPLYFSEMVSTFNIDYVRARAGDKSKSRTWLLSGPYGCGKTSLAQILARYLLWPNGNEPKMPADCPNIDMRITSINMAERNTRPEVSSIVSEWLEPKLFGERVFILDEPQRVDPDTQAIMYEPMDTAFKNDFFVIFCTTHPEKLSGMLRSRCTNVEFRVANRDELKNIGRRIFEEEGIDPKVELTKDIYETCLITSGGIPRIFIESLQSVLAGGSIVAPDAPSPSIIKLADAIETGQWDAVKEVIYSIGTDAEQLRRALTRIFEKRLLDNGKEDNYLRLIPFLNSPLDKGAGIDGRAWLTAVCYRAWKVGKDQ